MRVPSELAEEYHVRVRIQAGPFKVDEDYRSVIRAKDLPGQSGFLERLTGALMQWGLGRSDEKSEKQE